MEIYMLFICIFLAYKQKIYGSLKFAVYPGFIADDMINSHRTFEIPIFNTNSRNVNEAFACRQI